jgi:multiple sugar transport system permease protein
LEQQARRGESHFLLKYGFVGPALLLLLAFNIFPLLFNIYLSFTNTDASLTQVTSAGGENYGRVFRKADFGESIRITALFVGVVVSVELVLGFVLAMCMRESFRGRDVVLMVLLVPMMLCPLVVALFWKLILNSNYGLLYCFIRDVMGLSPPNLLEKMPMLSVMIVDIWMWTPFMMLIALAGLNSIPKYIYEAAEIDRAKRWAVFTRITLPMCAPILLLAVLLRVTDAIKQFDLVMALAGEGRSETTTLSVLLYKTAFQSNDAVGLATAYGFVILVAVMALATLFTRYIDRIQKGQGRA